MKKVVVALFLLFIPQTTFAKTFYEYKKESINSLCKTMIEEGGVHAIDFCGELMVRDSERKLQKRISEINQSLKEINNRKLTQDFIREQKSWEIYKKNLCSYMSLGREKDSPAYNSRFYPCLGVENYRRIEALIGEPEVTPPVNHNYCDIKHFMSTKCNNKKTVE